MIDADFDSRVSPDQLSHIAQPFPPADIKNEHRIGIGKMSMIIKNADRA